MARYTVLIRADASDNKSPGEGFMIGADNQKKPVIEYCLAKRLAP